MPVEETIENVSEETENANCDEPVSTPAYVDIELTAQDAGFLVDLIGLCKTPYDLVRYGSLTEVLVPQVSKFIQEFDKESQQFQASSQALYNTYYTQEEIEVDGNKTHKSVLKEGKSEEDFKNSMKGLQDEFEVKINKLKLTTSTYNIESGLIYSFLYNIDLSMFDTRKEKNPEMFTAQLYSIAKKLYDTVKDF